MMDFSPTDLIDFHVHSTASDGTCAPYELLIQAHSKGIKAIALTDHDTLAGLDSFTAGSRRLSIRAIPGIELSCNLPGHRLHVLGLGIHRRTWKLLDPFLETIKGWRHDRNSALLEGLVDLRIPICMDDIRVEAPGEIIARPHFARALVKKGFSQNLQEAFKSYVGHGGKAYIPKQKPELEEVISQLHAVGAVVIVCHPQSLVDGGSLKCFLDDLKQAGVDGFEARHPEMPEAMTREVEEYAAEHGLLVSSGSDFHGRNKRRNHLGRGRDGKKLFARHVQKLLTRIGSV
jgi:3',5'-nucleoside bisphosphate phosphatase